MLKSAQTVAASRSAWSETPAARTASASAAVSSSGRSVSFSRKTSVAVSSGRSGAVRQSSTTACQTSSPSAYDATAPWEPVQNGHWLSSDVNAGEELALAGAPVRRPAHHAVELLRERAARRARAGRASVFTTPSGSRPLRSRDLLQERRLRRARARGRRPRAGSSDHPIAASSRRRPCAIATATVCSKISSSEKPAALSAVDVGVGDGVGALAHLGEVRRHAVGRRRHVGHDGAQLLDVLAHGHDSTDAGDQRPRRPLRPSRKRASGPPA